MSATTDPTKNVAQRVGEIDTSGAPGDDAAHVTIRPIPASIGHYRLGVRLNLAAAQAANSRLFEVRNPGPNYLIPTLFEVRWTQTSAHTAAIMDALDLFKVTGFTAVDTVNTVTPTVSKARTGFNATSAVVRHVTVAGAAAGMTGGTLTKDGNSLSALTQWLLAAVPTTTSVQTLVKDFMAELDNSGAHPFVLAPNEGLELENSVLLGAAAGSDIGITMAFAEAVNW